MRSRCGIDLKTLCAAIQQGWQDEAALRNRDCRSKPGNPASEADLQALIDHYGDIFPADFLAFLQIHDGWEHITFGHNVLSAKGVIEDQEEFEWLIDDEPGFEGIVGIIWSENDGYMVFVDPETKELVSYLYEELDRFSTFREYLERRLKQVNQWVLYNETQQQNLLRDHDPAFRAETEAKIQERARSALEDAPTLAPAPIDLHVVPLYVRNRWQNPAFDSDEAHVCLSLSLYLGFAPTSEEMRAAFEVWRKHSKWEGPVKAGRFGGFFLSTLEDPTDEAVWEPWFEADVSEGTYGLVCIESNGSFEEKDSRCFSIRVMSEIDDQQAAPVCLITLPFDDDPQLLVDLAFALVEVLPVRSGIGGFQARYDRYPDECYPWCRQFPGLDLQDPNLVYPPLREGIRGAGWLTVLGPALANAIDAEAPDVTVAHTKSGAMVLQAGSEPTLEPITQGLPAPIIEVERCIAPLKIGNPAWAPTTRVFTQFQISDDVYGPWLYRFQDPMRFLRLSEGELGQLAEEVASQGTEEEIIELAQHPVPSRALYNAGCEADARGLRQGARAFYEAALTRSDCLPQTYGNLIVTYNEMGQYQQARDFVEANIHRNDPYIYANGACTYGELGNLDRALKMVKKARKLGLPADSEIRTDPSLAGLHQNTVFQALFDPA